VMLFTLLPYLAVLIFGVKAPAVQYGTIALGALYLPMGILGIGVRGDIMGCFPGYVLRGIPAAPLRYLPSVVLTAVAGFLILACFDGSLDKFPVGMKIVTETVAGWLLLAALHRAGVVHREEHSLQIAIPEPDPDPEFTESTTPSRPMSEIERMLQSREKERENSSHTPHL
jgi:hypothetical protein